MRTPSHLPPEPSCCTTTHALQPQKAEDQGQKKAAGTKGISGASPEQGRTGQEGTGKIACSGDFYLFNCCWRATTINIFLFPGEEVLPTELSPSRRARAIRLGQGRFWQTDWQSNTEELSRDFPIFTDFWRSISGEKQPLIHASKPPRLQKCLHHAVRAGCFSISKSCLSSSSKASQENKGG